MPRIYLDDLLNTSDNVIVTSACLGGILSKGADEVKERFLDFCIKNKHRCYLEIQHHNVEDQKNYNKELYALSREYGIPLIAGTDTHALNDTHMEGRKILQLSKGVHFAEEDAWDLTFKSFETLCEAYKRQDSLPEEVWMEAIMNTNRMADCVETFELDRNTKYPKIYDHPLQTYKQTESDLLVAVNPDGLSYSADAQQTVPLTFTHVMAKLAVNLTYKNQWGGIPTVEKVVVGNAAKEATINYLTKVVTPSTTAKEDFSLPEITENTKYVSVIIPQEEVKQLTIVIGGKNFVYDNGTPFKLESGKITTVNLEVGRDEIKLGDVKITDWEDGSTFSGEAIN